MFRVMKSVVAVAAVGTMAVSVGTVAAGAQPRAHVTSAAAAAHVTSAKRLPAVLNCSNKRLVRPRGELVLACGDGNAEITKTVWSSWTTKQATGTTKFYLNSCTPSCSADSMKLYRDAKVRLHDVVSTKHGRLFSEATITYRSHGKTHRLTFELAD